MNSYDLLLALYNESELPDELSFQEIYKILAKKKQFPEIVGQLGINFVKALLSLLCYECRIYNADIYVQLHKQTNKFLKSFSAIIAELANNHFQINEQLVELVLLKSQSGEALPSILRLLIYARDLQLIDVNNQIIRDEFDYLNVNYLYFYDFLQQKNNLATNVLKNLAYGKPPKEKSDDLIMFGQVVSFLCNYNVLDALNSLASKYDRGLTLSNCSNRGIKMLLSELEYLQQNDWIHQNILIILCLLPVQQSEYGTFRNFIDNLNRGHIVTENSDSTLHQIIESFKAMQGELNFGQLFSHLELLGVFGACVISPKLIEEFVTVSTLDSRFDHKLHDLARNNVLNEQTYRQLFDNCVNESGLISNTKKIQHNKKVSYEEIKVRIIVMLTKVGLSKLIHPILAVQKSHTNFFSFLYNLYCLGELTHQRVSHSLAVNIFNKKILFHQYELAKYRIPISDGFHGKSNFMEYSQPLLILAKANCTLTKESQEYVTLRPLLLKRIIDFFSACQQPLSASPIDNIIAVISAQYDHSAPNQIVNLISVQVILGWPSFDIDDFNQLVAPDNFVRIVKQFSNRGVYLSLDAEEPWLINAIKKDQVPDWQILLLSFLYARQVIKSDNLSPLLSLNQKQTNQLYNALMMMGRYNIDLSEYSHALFNAKDFISAAYTIIKFKQSHIDFLTFWPLVNNSLIPELLIEGLLLLCKKPILFNQYASRLAQVNRPDLVAGELIRLEAMGAVNDDTWTELTSTSLSTDEEQYFLQESQYSQEKLTHLSSEIRHAINLHKDPSFAYQMYLELLTIPEISQQDILSILSYSNARKVVSALKELSQLSQLNFSVICQIQHYPEKINLVKDYYRLANADNWLLDKIFIVEDVATSRQFLDFFVRINNHQLFSKFYLGLKEIFEKTPFDAYDNLLTILNKLLDKNIIDDLVLDILNCYFFKYSDVGQLIIFLKRDNLLEKNIIKRIMGNCHDDRVINCWLGALNSIAQTTRLSRSLFEIMDAELFQEEIVCLGRLMAHKDVAVSQVMWLKDIFCIEYNDKTLRNSAKTWRRWLVAMFDRLRETEILDYSLMQIIIESPRCEPMLHEAAYLLIYIPKHLLNKDIVEKALTTYGICYSSDSGEFYNPFKKFSNNNISLLTKEVIDITFKQNYGESYNVYYMMESLERAGLFSPEIIKECVSESMVAGYVALHKQQLLNKNMRRLLQLSQYPEKLADLIILLNQKNLYDKLIEDVLISISEQKYVNNPSRVEYHFIMLMEFVKVLPSMSSLTLHTLLSHHIDWRTYYFNIYPYLQKATFSEQIVRLMVTIDMDYLKSFVTYFYKYSESNNISANEIILLARYEHLLNHQVILEVLNHVDNWFSQSTLDSEKLRKIYKQIWSLCESQDQQEIIDTFKAAYAVPPNNALTKNVTPSSQGFNRSSLFSSSTSCSSYDYSSDEADNYSIFKMSK